MTRDLSFKWYFPHSPSLVWECLTVADIIAEWLMENDFKPVVGHKFNFHTRPIPKMDFDGVIYCEILEVVDNQRLVYSWKGGPAPGVITLDTVLTWTLIPKENGTEVRLEHSGFKGFKNYLSSLFMGAGWSGRIRKRLETLLNEKANVTT